MERTIKISEETYQKLKDQLGESEPLNINCYQDLIGKKWFFRTVSYHSVGKAIKLIGNLIQLENASWIADSGRFMDCIQKGKLDEVEPVGTMWVNLDTVVDMFEWKHELPKEQK